MKYLRCNALPRAALASLLALLALGATALPRQAAPAVSRKVVLENDRVNVVEITVEPGGVIPRHRHERDAVIVTLEGEKLEEILPDGNRNVRELKPGGASWRAKGHEHEERNTGKTRIRVYIIELKP
jgi:quercetin dioxygenase-like cupin family protein